VESKPRAILLLVLAGLSIGSIAWVLSSGTTTEEVRWRNGAVELAGTLYLPAGNGPHPAAVFLHGWGDWSRAEQLFSRHARRLARDGLALLIYDKRGCGESSGDWRRASFADLADDALAGTSLLRRHARIRPDRIGLFGTSLGGSIALLAASRSPEVAFIATLSLSTSSPADHAPTMIAATLRRARHGEAEIAAAVALDRQIKQVYRTDTGWDDARAAVERCATQPWFAAAGIELHPRESPVWRWYRDLPMDLDPVPLLERLEIPFFAALGEEDPLVPAEREQAILESIAREHDRDFTVVVIPGVGHTLRKRSGWPIERWTWPESYWKALESWLAKEVIDVR
jgi:pimeloyl-ACP methyl ester carboxylesterase